MSFNVSASTSETLTFSPSRVDINWDGVSNGRVTILPVCSDTASTASYSVRVLHVFGEATTKAVYASSISSSYSAVAGEPYKTGETTDSRTATPFTIGSTLSTATGQVSFELIPSDTNYTNTFDYATYPTSQPAQFKWEMSQTRGTATQLVACGRMLRIPPNPYSSSGFYGSLIQAQTASFCIG